MSRTLLSKTRYLISNSRKYSTNESNLRPQKILILSGPTASGKNGLAVKLAKRIDAEIISVDSAKVFKGLDIATSKPSLAERLEIRHHLMDIRPISAKFSNGDFQRECQKVMHDLALKKKNVIVVGGSGFYLKWLMLGPEGTAPPVTNESLFRTIAEYVQTDRDAAWRELEKVDPASTARIERNDHYRIQRALYVYRETGRPYSSFRSVKESTSATLGLRSFVIYPPRDLLYKAIDLRCEKMVDSGLLQETYHLMNLRESFGPESSRVIGYRQALDFLHNWRWTIEEFEEFLKQFQAMSRQYSRRQVSFFRQIPHFLWVPLQPNNTSDINNEIQRVAQSEEVQDHILKHYEMNDQDFQSAIIRQKQLNPHMGEASDQDLSKLYKSVNKIFDAKVTITNFLRKVQSEIRDS